jgi:hypothetical protein
MQIQTGSEYQDFCKDCNGKYGQETSLNINIYLELHSVVM